MIQSASKKPPRFKCPQCEEKSVCVMFVDCWKCQHGHVTYHDELERLRLEAIHLEKSQDYRLFMESKFCPPPSRALSADELERLAKLKGV